MNIKSGTEVANESWGDVRLSNISWGNEGRDIVLTFHMHQQRIGRLTGTWAHSLNIGLLSGNNEGGYPLTYEAKINEGEVNGWQVLFDFANRGLIEFKCNDLTLEG